MKCYLAIDKGKGTLPEDEDRYVLIDVSKLGYIRELSKGKKIVNEPRDYFSSLEEAINFTSQYESYSELFMKLYENGLIDKSLVGKPFTYCYYSEKKANPEKNTWKHYGEKEYISYDKVIFRKNAYLFDNPSSDELEKIRKSPKEKKLSITEELLRLELYITDDFNLESESFDPTEKRKYYFLKALIEKFTKMVNEKKKAKIYDPNPIDGRVNDYTYHVDKLEFMIKELNAYLKLAKEEHTVESEYFYEPMIYIVNNLCIKSYKDKYVIDKTALFDIASFCIAYRERISKKHSVEIAMISSKIEELELSKNNHFGPIYTGEQLTFFDDEYQNPLTRERKKGNN